MPNESVVAKYLHNRFNIPLNLSSLVDLPLEFASLAYKPVTGFRNLLFESAILKVHKLKRPVISIGNMTIGGSGKTPLVSFLANEFASRGVKSVVLSRGYRPGKSSIKIPLIVDHLNPEAHHLYGDEAVLLSKNTDSKVVVCRNRLLSGRVAENQLNPSIFILDDGFQARYLHRNFDILLIDATKEITTRLFPRGSLREGWSGIKRANLIIFSKANLTTQNRIDKWKNYVFKFNKNVPIIEMGYTFGETKKVEFDSLKGEKVFVVAAIADPEGLSRMIVNSGLHVVGHSIYRDHYLFNQKNIDDCESEAKRRGAKFIVTTEKDGVRLRGLNKKAKWIELPLKINIETETIFNLFRQKGIQCDLKSSEFST